MKGMAVSQHNVSMLDMFLHGMPDGSKFGMQVLHLGEKWRRAGLRVDLKRAFTYQRYAQAYVTKCEELISQMLGPYFNWASPKQVAELYYEKWKLPKQYNTKQDKKTGQKVQVLTTDDDARTAIKRWLDRLPASTREQYKQALIYFQLHETASEYKKLGDYFNRISPDGRIHVYWQPYAETYRWKSKPNIQNWPTWSIGKDANGRPLPNTRSVVIPDNDDDCFIAIDFEQIQLWTYAAIFGIKNLLRIYESGDYVYGAVYERLNKGTKPFFQAGKPRTKKYRHPDVTDQELLRAKAVPLGFLFDRSGESVAVEHGWPTREGVQLKNEWFADNPELGEGHSWIKYQVGQKGELRPPPGLLLHYPQFNLQAYNCFGQTPEFAMVASSCVMMEEEFERRGWEDRTVLTVHDSILVNVRHGLSDPSRCEQVYYEVMKPVLERPVYWLDGFRYRHEVKFGKMWDWEMKGWEEWKNQITTQTTPLAS